MHPNLPFLQKLYNDGDATFIANMGALTEPMTVKEYRAKTKTKPPGLFAHNTMQVFERLS